MVRQAECIWIIRWTDQVPQVMECKSGSREEVERYAREKSKEKGRYIIV